MAKNSLIYRYQAIIDKLQDRGYRLTNIRKAIIKIVSNSQHISMNDIIEQLKQDNDNVNIMSIYNTIDLLLAEDIIHANVGENKQVYYELSDNVIHITCNMCHSLIHFTNQEKDAIMKLYNLEKIKDYLLEHKNFNFSHFNLEIHGTCQKCHNKI